MSRKLFQHFDFFNFHHNQKSNNTKILSTMILRLIPRSFRCLNLFKLTLLPNLPRAFFAQAKKQKKVIDERLEEERMMLQDEERSGWNNKYDDIVSDYPFLSIPVEMIRDPARWPLQKKQIKDLVAFKALRANQNDAEIAAKFLFPNKDDEFIEGIEGREVFSRYMKNRVEECINQLNKGEGTLKQRIASLIILNNIKSKTLREKVQKINAESIINQDQSGILLAYYVQILIKVGINCKQYFQTILAKLEDDQNPPQNRLKIAKAVITTFGFRDRYPIQILQAAMKALTANISNMHPYQLLFVIRQVYQYQSPESINFANSVQEYLIKKHTEQLGVDFHIPLILKTVSYCNSLRISTDELLKFIIANMQRLQINLKKKKVSKELFLSHLLSKTNKEVSPELVNYLKEYFYQGIETFIQSDQCDEKQVLRFSKLLSKYFHYFSEEEQQNIKYNYIQQMIPYYCQSTDVLFYSLIVYLRTKKQQKEGQPSQQGQQQNQKAKKYIKIFFQMCCRRNKAQQLVVQTHINEVIQIVYEIYRHNIKFRKRDLPMICRYDYRSIESLTAQALDYFFKYLLKTQHEQKEDVRQALKSAQTLLESYIRRDIINSFKMMLCMIDVGSSVDYEDDFFYKALENALAKYLIKYPKFVILQKDLKFLNERMIKRGYGSSGLKKLIAQTLQRPKNWENNRKTYTDRQKKYLQHIKQKRRGQISNKRER